MIFTTVGSQMPFDRLIYAVDAWAVDACRDEVFAQIGNSTLKPKNIKYVTSLTPAQFTEQVIKCDLVVAHAGMGSILTALEYSKPLVLLARKGDLMETRNDHQIATAKWLGLRTGIFVAPSENDIGKCIEAGLASSNLSEAINQSASPLLVETIAQFIDDTS